MAPLADTIALLVLALLLLVGRRCWSKLGSLRFVVFVFAFYGFLSGLSYLYKLHFYASVLLAAGLAAQLATLVVKHYQLFQQIVRRTTGGILAFVVVASVGVHEWERIADSLALATSSPHANAPNVLLIVLDTVRASNLSLYGYQRPTTPNLERLAKQGVLFDWAMSTAPWTLPSHASMFTGRIPNELSVSWLKPLDQAYPTLAEVLTAHGYATAGFVANLAYCSAETGLNRGFTHFEDYPVSPGQISLSAKLLARIIYNQKLRQLIDYHEDLNRKAAPELNRDFLNWLSTNKKRPFFAFINYYDAHEPFLPPKPYNTMFGPVGSHDNPRFAPGRVWSPQEMQYEQDAYDGAIRYLDDQIGLLMNELRRRKVFDNTLVIITSDHGEEFLEHGLMGHGYSLYERALHVPLLMLLPPRIPAGKTIAAPVSLKDIPATVLDLLQIKGGLPGNTLARYWTSSVETMTEYPVLSMLEYAPGLPESYPVSKGNMESSVTDRYHSIKNGDGREELYDYKNDPLEKQNLRLSNHVQTVLK
jgi:arylsulfatase A-like enzyme